MKNPSEFEHDYALLCIKDTDSWSDIKLAYKRLVKVNHPDRHPDGKARLAAEERLKLINKSYMRIETFYNKFGTLPRRKPVKPVRDFQPKAKQKNTINLSNFIANPNIAHKKHTRRFAFPLLVVLITVLTFYYFMSDSMKTSIVEYENKDTMQIQDLSAQKDIKSMQFNQTKRNKTNLDEKPDYFTYGSTKEDVLRIQGAPIHSGETEWKYRISVVYFKNNKVISWLNSDYDPLKVKE